MRTKKTIALKTLIQKTNHYLAYVGTPTKEMRLGASVILEAALHEGGAYAGYLYLSGFENDKSRRVYLVHKRLGSPLK